MTYTQTLRKKISRNVSQFAKFMKVLFRKNYALYGTTDAGRPLVQATYHLGRDGHLALVCFEELDKMLQAVRDEIAKKLSHGQPCAIKQYVEYAVSYVQPAFTYSHDKLQGKLLPAVSALKAARLLHLNKMADMQSESVAVDSLLALSFSNNSDIENLKTELPHFLALAKDVSPQFDVVR